MLSKGDILYHGSYAEVRTIDLAQCVPGKDFGKGFYLTSSYEQAQKFIRTSLRKAQAIGRVEPEQHYGYVSSFRLTSLEGLVVYDFPDADASWLRYVSVNRRPQLAEELFPTLDPLLREADVVIGKIANDTTNRVIATYLNGLYGEIGSARAEETAIALLLPERLEDQYCFRTKEAVAKLELVEVDRHDL